MTMNMEKKLQSIFSVAGTSDREMEPSLKRWTDSEQSRHHFRSLEGWSKHHSRRAYESRSLWLGIVCTNRFEQGTTNVAIYVEEPLRKIEVALLIVSSYLYVATL